jgi:hypothetical protein
MAGHNAAPKTLAERIEDVLLAALPEVGQRLQEMSIL